MEPTGRELIERLKADTIRQYGKFTWMNIIRGFFVRRCFRPIVTMRLCQVVHASRALQILFPFARIIHLFATSIASMDLPWQTDIGPGFCIFHGWGIVINSKAKIGRNVTLLHGVTIGRRDRISGGGERTDEYPVIEDNVCVGPNAIIIGAVRVGDGCRIAGGAFVTENIPPKSIVIGNPAKICKNDCVPDVINPV